MPQAEIERDSITTVTTHYSSHQFLVSKRTRECLKPVQRSKSNVEEARRAHQRNKEEHTEIRGIHHAANEGSTAGA